MLGAPAYRATQELLCEYLLGEVDVEGRVSEWEELPFVDAQDEQPISNMRLLATSKIFWLEVQRTRDHTQPTHCGPAYRTLDPPEAYVLHPNQARGQPCRAAPRCIDTYSTLTKKPHFEH